MKVPQFIMAACIVVLLFACSEKKSNEDTTTSAKAILLQQLKNTHTQKEWFVPVNIALEDLTPEQAMWRDSSGNHSIGQLAFHLFFWNKRLLRKFNGDSIPDFTGNNEETFTDFDQVTLDKTISGLDSVLTAFEKGIEQADEKKLTEWYATLANMNIHNAYHTGQILYIRKMKKSWDAEKGVK
jgi:uncharacterized damage-inducible protein DinB